MKIAKSILQLLLIAQFGFFGISKILGTPDMVETFTTFGYASWFMVFTGALEVTAVLFLLYGFLRPEAVYVGAFLIVGITIGAALSHTFVEGSISNAVIPLVVLAQNCLMAWLHSRTATMQLTPSLA